MLAADARDLTTNDLLAKAGLDLAPEVVVGGPPCQGFSSAGARKADDQRNSLVGVFARLVAETRPNVFIFENVEGFLTASGGAFVTTLLDQLLETGYHIRLAKMNVANYGVPQLRKRVICVGALAGPPDIPTPTHWAWGAPGVELAGGTHLSPALPVDEALDGLPPAEQSPPGALADHWAAPCNGLDAERMAALTQGQTMRDLPEQLQHASYRRRANRRVSDGMPTERRGGAPAGLRRLRGDEPSKAITSAASREFIHPVEDRPLTLRECARLQTFPDEFVFLGTRGERNTLIGNAVPPLFAQCIGESIRPWAFEHPERNEPGRGKLWSFEVSHSGGRSPALREVEQRVLRRYGKSPVAYETEPLWQ
jgi:DNA (cytosine-5)-methyltransferase 1